MKRTTKINDLTLRPYNARVSPKFTVEVTFTHDALGDGYVNEVSQELTRRQEGDEGSPSLAAPPVPSPLGHPRYGRALDGSRRSWLGPPGED